MSAISVFADTERILVEFRRLSALCIATLGIRLLDLQEAFFAAFVAKNDIRMLLFVFVMALGIIAQFSSGVMQGARCMLRQISCVYDIKIFLRVSVNGKSASS